MFIPSRVFITTGYGYHEKQLGSFELALRQAGIQAQNLVYVSSIFPPRCQIIPKSRGLELLRPGEITFCVMAKQSTDENGRLAGASVGIAIPRDRNRYGYLSEVHGFGKTQKEIGDDAEDLAAEFLAASLDLPFDINKSWNQRMKEWKLGGHIVTTKSCPIVKSGKSNQWLTVVSVAVLLT